MATRKAIAWLEGLTWVYIYGGLFILIIGIRLAQDDHAATWWLVTIGTVIAATGFTMIYVRSRLKEDSP